MAGREWPPAERALLLRLVQEGRTPFQCFEDFQSAQIDRTQKAIARHIQEGQRLRPDLWHAQVQPSKAPLLLNHIVWESNRTLCIFDPHCPFHDAVWLNRLVSLSISLAVDTCIIGGDLVDNNALSPFEKQQGITLVDEIESAQQLIRMLARSFKKVLFIAGNHDLRVTKKLDWAIPLQNDLEKFIEADVDNATASDYRWMELRNGGETYRIVHPKNSSVNSPLVPRKLASKYHCHIVGGHGHTVGLSRDDSNWYWAIDAGVTNDPRKISYVTKEMSIRPMVMQGAVLILDGIPVLLTPQNILLYES